MSGLMRARPSANKSADTQRGAGRMANPALFQFPALGAINVRARPTLASGVEIRDTITLILERRPVGARDRLPAAVLAAFL